MSFGIARVSPPLLHWELEPNPVTSIRNLRTDGMSSDKSGSLYSPIRFDSYHGAYESHEDSELLHSISYFVLLFATFVVERVFRFVLGLHRATHFRVSNLLFAFHLRRRCVVGEE